MKAAYAVHVQGLVAGPRTFPLPSQAARRLSAGERQRGGPTKIGGQEASPNALEAERLLTLLRLAAERRWCDSFLAGTPPAGAASAGIHDASARSAAKR